jgi:hypothetical protein
MKFLLASILALSSAYAAAVDVTQEDFVSAVRSQWGPVILMDGAFLTRFPELPEEPVWRISNATGTICTVAEGLCLTVIPGRRADRDEETIALTKLEPGAPISPYMRWDIIAVPQADGGAAYRILSRVMAKPVLALDADRHEGGQMMLWPANGSPQQLFTFPGARPAPVPLVTDALMEELNGAADAMDYRYIFAQAVRQGNLPVLQAVLRRPEVDPNQGGNQFLMEAVADGRAAIVRALLADPRVAPSPHGCNVILQHGRFNPAAQDNKALKEAQAMGAHEIAQLLRADPRVAE